MVQRPVEKDQVRIVIKNPLPKYQEKLMFQSINTFAELFDASIRIYDAIREGKIFLDGRGKSPTYHQGNQANPTDVNQLENGKP